MSGLLQTVLGVVACFRRVGESSARRFEDAMGVLKAVQDLSGDRCQAMWHLLGKCHKELGPRWAGGSTR